MPAHKQGKGGTRKHGRGVRKAQKSRFNSFAGIIGASEMRKELRRLSRIARLARRRKKRGGFRTKRAALRFKKYGEPRTKKEGTNAEAGSGLEKVVHEDVEASVRLSLGDGGLQASVDGSSRASGAHP